jgi:endonuclease/exonuclease/phosphatase family metal-dependent hydrolase
MARLRLLTYNIAHARGLTLHQGLRSAGMIRAHLMNIARLIQRLEADIVALQEIDEHSLWNGSFNHLEYLRTHTGLGYAVHGVHNRLGGRFPLNYGNAILSRYPIHHSETVPFGKSIVGGKGFLFAEIDAPKGRLPIVNVHMHHTSRPTRLKQAAQMMAFLDAQRAHRSAHWKSGPIVCGDLNNPSHAPDATAMLLGYLEQFDNYTLLPKGLKLGRAAHTFPSVWPSFALDYVYLPSRCVEPEVTVVRSYLSDHRPVFVDFKFTPPE